MCGLVGFSASREASSALWVRAAFLRMLVAAAERGRDATGMAFVTLHKGAPEGIHVQRWTEPSSSVVQRFGTLDAFWQDPISTMLAHTRAASVGSRHARANVHPFVHGNIVLAHNGHMPAIREVARSEGLRLKGETDSEALAALLNRSLQDAPLGADGDGTVEASLAAAIDRIEAVYGIRGDWALAVMDRRVPETVYLATNGRRPLAIAQVQVRGRNKDEHAVFWASTPEILTAGLGAEFAGSVSVLNAGDSVVLRRGRIMERSNVPLINGGNQHQSGYRQKALAISYRAASRPIAEFPRVTWNIPWS